jgi:hypothetical protein
MAFVVEGKNKKLLFIHIPKTGGKSVKQALTGSDFEVFPHTKFSQVPPFIRDQYFVAAFVRNPWARLVSTFFYLRQGGQNIFDEIKRSLIIGEYLNDFERFVKKELQENSEFLLQQILFTPQYRFLVNEEGSLGVDYIGKVESFTKDFDSLCEIIGVQDVELPHHNKSNHSSYTEYYDSQMVSIVRELYHKDIEILEYEFATS